MACILTSIRFVARLFEKRDENYFYKSVVRMIIGIMKTASMFSMTPPPHVGCFTRFITNPSSQGLTDRQHGKQVCFENGKILQNVLVNGLRRWILKYNTYSSGEFGDGIGKRYGLCGTWTMEYCTQQDEILEYLRRHDGNDNEYLTGKDNILFNEK